jgi:hypothetical protein
MAAEEQRLNPTTCCGSLPNTVLCLTNIIDGNGAFEHSLLQTPIKRDVVQLFVQAQAITTPTVSEYFGAREVMRRGGPDAEPKLRRFYPEWAAGFALWPEDTYEGAPLRDDMPTKDNAGHHAEIMKAGGCVAVGLHTTPAIGTHHEMWYFVEGGMSPHDALRAGTLCGAIAIGHGKDIGSIEPGKLADFVILDRNPLDDIRNTTAIRYVMKDGRLYDDETLDEVWPRNIARGQ